jgi:hypothetical protein
MHVFMIAFLALAIFGVIGLLLAIAVCCEPKQGAPQAPTHGAPLGPKKR